MQSSGSDTSTEGIRVSAEAFYRAQESAPAQRQFVYEYRIRIANEGTERARLRSRHWVILDADNNRRDVRGPGVVGEYPDLAPGEDFTYTSSCPLSTRWGTMEGSYTFERADGRTFDAKIGRFFLVPQRTPAPAAS